MIGMTFISGEGDEVERIDDLGEIFRQEMEVNIAPFQTFKELRLCSSGDDMFSVMESLQDYVGAELFLNSALEGTGVDESRSNLPKELAFGLMNDYLFTRLRNYIEFPDDFEG